jgi:hypothetical protein
MPCAPTRVFEDLAWKHISVALHDQLSEAGSTGNSITGYNAVERRSGANLNTVALSQSQEFPNKQVLFLPRQLQLVSVPKATSLWHESQDADSAHADFFSKVHKLSELPYVRFQRHKIDLARDPVARTGPKRLHKDLVAVL